MREITILQGELSDALAAILHRQPTIDELSDYAHFCNLDTWDWLKEQAKDWVNEHE